MTIVSIKGVINIVQGSGRDVGQRIAEHPSIKYDRMIMIMIVMIVMMMTNNRNNENMSNKSKNKNN